MAPRWSIALTAPPAAPPLISGDVLIVPLQTGAIVALRSADGSLAWRVDLAAERAAAIDNDLVYVPSNRALHALRVATGDTAWHADTGRLTAPPLARSGWVIVAAAGDVMALRGSDGAVLWRRTLGPVEHRPAIDGDLLLVPLVDRRIAALDLQTGSSRWERLLGGAPGELLAVGERVYAGATDKLFYALNSSNGEIKWHQLVGAAPRGLAAADDDHVYFVAMDNVLRALDRGHGAIEWTKALSFRPAAGPMLIGGAVAVPGSVATLSVFSAKGAALGTITFPGSLATVPDVQVGDDGQALMAAVTGDLEHQWTLSLLVALPEPPALPLAPLTAPPGEIVPLGMPR